MKRFVVFLGAQVVFGGASTLYAHKNNVNRMRTCLYSCRAKYCPKKQPLCRLPRSTFEPLKTLGYPSMPPLLFELLKAKGLDAKMTDVIDFLVSRAAHFNRKERWRRDIERKRLWKALVNPYVRSRGPLLKLNLVMYLYLLRREHLPDAKKFYFFILRIVQKAKKYSMSDPRYIEPFYVHRLLLMLVNNNGLWNSGSSLMRGYIKMTTMPIKGVMRRRIIRRHQNALAFPFCWCKPLTTQSCRVATRAQRLLILAKNTKRRK